MVIHSAIFESGTSRFAVSGDFAVSQAKQILIKREASVVIPPVSKSFCKDAALKLHRDHLLRRASFNIIPKS